jgi:hypothetical protein
MTTTTRGVTRRRVAAGLVAGASLATFAGLTSGAFFTDSASIDGNNFAFGTVSIATNPSTAPLFSLPAALPGDSFTGPLAVKNDGTMQMRYAVESLTTDDVTAAALGLTVKSGVADCSAAGFGASGTTLYTGVLGTVAGTKVFGDKATGTQGGERVLGAGAQDDLCVQVNVPKAVDNSFQGDGTVTQFKFFAEQTANNA